MWVGLGFKLMDTKACGPVSKEGDVLIQLQVQTLAALHLLPSPHTPA